VTRVQISTDAFISRVWPTTSPFHTQLLFRSRVPDQGGSTLRFHCYVPCKQHPDFPDIQIDNQIPLSFSPLLSLSVYLVVFPNMSHAFISRIRLTTFPFHTWLLFPSLVPGQPCSTLRFHCSTTYKQHPEFWDIQIDHRSPSSCPLSCYTFCSQKFGDIQFDHRALTSPEYNLWPCFEARPTAFHTWPFLGISFTGGRVSRFMKCPTLNRSSPSPPPWYFFLDMQLLSFNTNRSSFRNR